MDDDSPRRRNDLLLQIGTEDLDPFSVAELEERIAALEVEIARTRRKVEAAVDHRASADALFRR